ncbi:MAG: glycosyltransferase [Chitinophagaceae bacterium]
MADKKIYLVKNLSPWMMDELVAFAEQTPFTLILLRGQDSRYDSQLKALSESGVDVVAQPFTGRFSWKKVFFLTRFILSHPLSFMLGYSAVIGWKSAYWFFRLDTKLFPDTSVIHAQFATQPALVALLFKKYTSGRIGYYFTFHAYDIYFANRWFALLVNQSIRAFSISAFNIKYVAEKFKKVDSSRLSLSRLGANAPAIQETRESNDIFTIGFLGRFVEKKGVEYLLKAMEILQEQNKPVRLLLAGDGPLMESYRQLISQAGLTNVTLTGSVQGDGKEQFFKRLDAFVMPSVKLKNDMDGIPVVLMETLSYQTPMIATDISGMGEICINDYNGLLIPERDGQAIANAIKLLSQDPGLHRKFSENSASMFLQYDIRINSLQKLKDMNWS